MENSAIVLRFGDLSVSARAAKIATHDRPDEAANREAPHDRKPRNKARKLPIQTAPAPDITTAIVQPIVSNKRSEARQVPLGGGSGDGATLEVGVVGSDGAGSAGAGWPPPKTPESSPPTASPRALAAAFASASA